MKSFIILLGIILLVSLASATETTCSSCEDCSTKLDGSYDTVNLDTDITGHSGTCITIGSSGVEFDCQNHIIDGGDSSDTYGIYGNGKSHLTVKNCVITDFQMGIRAEGASNLTITSNNASSNLWDGIYLKYVNDSLISYNVLNSNDDGLYLDSSNGNTVSGNTMTSNSYSGIILLNSDSNVLSSNEACSNGDSDFYLYSGSGNSGDINVCGTASGWNDDGTTGCTYACGETTTSTTTSTSTTTLSTDATCSSCADCSAKLDGTYETVKLTTDLLDQTETCIQFGSGYVEFDCQGHTIDGDETAGAGVNIADSYALWSATVRNCVVTDFWYGIRLLNAYSCDIIGNTVTSNNDTGIRTENAFYNTIENNTITANEFGLLVTSASYPNYIRNNVVNSNSWIGIYMYGADFTRVNENEACYNAESDFWTMNSDNNTGTNNTCNNPHDWNDDNITGCTFSCSAVTTTTTTTTIAGECTLVGDTEPCGTITLSEVIDLISLWAAEGAELSDVIDLINAWSG